MLLNLVTGYDIKYVLGSRHRSDGLLMGRSTYKVVNKRKSVSTHTRPSDLVFDEQLKTSRFIMFPWRTKYGG